MVLGVKNLPANAGILMRHKFDGSGRSPEGGHGNLLRYSCLENSMDRGAWRATVHGITESDATEQLTFFQAIWSAPFLVLYL